VTEPNRAVAELVALVAKMREDWPPHTVQGVIVNAAAQGLTWPQTVVGLVRLAVDPAAKPGELIPDRNDPTRPGRHDDATYKSGLDAARKGIRPLKVHRAEPEGNR
jgi:hypothetical protein